MHRSVLGRSTRDLRERGRNQAKYRALVSREVSDNGDSMTQRQKPKSSSQIYSGALAEPLKPRLRHRLRRFRPRARPSGTSGSGYTIPLPSLPANSSSLPRWRREYDQKLPLLLDHFGIPREDPNRWQMLSLCLAVAHVPGFQVGTGRKRGRPREMPLEEEAKLYARFCALRKDRHSDRNATRLLVKESWKEGGAKISESAILRRMQRCDQKSRELAALFRNMTVGFQVAQNPVS